MYHDFLYLFEFQRKFGKIIILCNLLIVAGFHYNNYASLSASISSPF